MPTLHISLLGDFGLTYDDQNIDGINTARLKSLLAYLVLHQSAPQSRRQLAFLLWPDSSEAQARTNLRNLLYLMRQALPSADDFLLVDNLTVQWNPKSSFTLDVFDFEKLVIAADEAPSQGDEHLFPKMLEESITLYRGDLLCECYDDWIQPERERLRQIFTYRLEKLIDLLVHQNEAAVAIKHAQRLLRLDPLHESGYQQLMRIYTQLGDRAHALNTYRTCETVLKRELGVPPSTATQMLYQQLREITQQTTYPTKTFEPPQTRQPLHNLPALLTTFIGRTWLLSAIKQSLQKARLLTLTGPGGCGKTRLALAVSDEIKTRYPDGVWLVELGALQNTNYLYTTVARVLAIPEESGQPLLTTLIESLRDKHLLLLLDTCEHLVEKSAEFARTLLHACPKLQIIATSRERLAIAGETVWSIPPLTVPSRKLLTTVDEISLSQLNEFESVQLLVDRIQSVLPTFTVTQQNARAICQICIHLDGMPLAIELAAAKAAIFSPDEIESHLAQRFQILHSSTRDTIARHQTLRAAIDWSFDRLNTIEQVLLRRLAIFPGTFTLQTIQHTCIDLSSTTTQIPLTPNAIFDQLAHLVDKSLVNVILQSKGTTRYSLLETIRAYSYEHLQAANEEVIYRTQHLLFFTQLVETAEVNLRGSKQNDWLDQLETEQSNLQYALDWSLKLIQSSEQVVMGLRLGGSLWRFWIYRGYYNEGSQHLEKLLSMTNQPTTEYAKVLLGAGCLAGEMGEYDHAEERLLAALSIYRSCNQLDGIAEATYRLAWLENWRGNPELSRHYYDESIVMYRQLDNSAGLAWALRGLAWLDRISGDLGQAQSRIAESLKRFEELGDKAGLCFAYNGLAYIALDQDNYADAQKYAEQSLVYARQIDDRHAISIGLRFLGRLAQKTKQYQQATDYFTESLEISCTLNDKYGTAQNFHGRGDAWMQIGDLAKASVDFQEAQHFYQYIDYKPGLAWLSLSTGDLAKVQGNLQQAAAEYQSALILSKSIQQPWLINASQQRLELLADLKNSPQNV